MIISYGQTDSKDTMYFNTAFRVGEVLKYNVSYGIIKGGEATLSTALYPDGYSYVYHFKAHAITTGMVRRIATISDIYESYVDIQTGLPIKSIRNIHENNYVSYNEVLFWQEKNYAMSIKTGKHDVPAQIHDILSAFYFARRYLFDRKLNKNDVIELTTFFDDEVFPIKIKYKKTETISTKIGKIECLKFVPVLEKNNPLKKEDDLQIWFSNDKNFIPVKLKLDMPVSSVRCDLINFENLKNEFTSLRKSKLEESN